MSAERAAVVSVGSLNMDFVVHVARLPQQGETVAGREFNTLPGGKGANQACAVGRLSRRPNAGALVGCVGQDIFGSRLIEGLRSDGVDTRHVRVTSEAATGVALIVVEQGGQNQIVIAPGANDCLHREEVVAALTSLGASYLLLQLESPPATVEAAAQQGRALGMTVILDPAPARPLPSTLLRCVDILTPNESEALMLAGLSGSQISLQDAPVVARRLLALGPRQVILKLGVNGAYLFDAQRERHFPAFAISAKDATAAGDCFNGALAAGLAESLALEEALEFACAAAAISVTQLGAQRSIPHRAEVEKFLRGHRKPNAHRRENHES